MQLIWKGHEQEGVQEEKKAREEDEKIQLTILHQWSHDSTTKDLESSLEMDLVDWTTLSWYSQFYNLHIGTIRSCCFGLQPYPKCSGTLTQ